MMPRMRFHLLAAAFAALALGASDARAQPAAGGTSPVVVELYTSQGCTQCLRANRFIGELTREPDVVPLTFPVGYWDYLGWVDTFARPEFTTRQREFGRALRVRAPFTPQLIIGGIRQVSASDWDEARSTLMEVQAMAPPEGAPTLTLHRLPHGGARAVISEGSTPAPADVLLVAYEPGPIAVTILGGENHGRVVLHYNLVRRIWPLGSWTGAPLTLDSTHCSPECALIVEAANHGRILAATMTRPGHP